MAARPSSVRVSATSGGPSGGRMESRPRARVEAGAQAREAGVRHQAAEVALRQPGGRRRVEGRVALRQGEAAVVRQALARGERHLLQRLRAQALHRVAVDGFDAHGGRDLRLGARLAGWRATRLHASRLPCPWRPRHRPRRRGKACIAGIVSPTKTWERMAAPAGRLPRAGPSGGVAFPEGTPVTWTSRSSPTARGDSSKPRRPSRSASTTSASRRSTCSRRCSTTSRAPRRA